MSTFYGPRARALGAFCAVAVLLSGCNSTSPTSPSTAPSYGTPSQLGPLEVTNPGNKVSLCHVTGNGKYVPIQVGIPADAAHRGHGDAAVGETVPAQPDHVFDSNCVPIVSITTYIAKGEISTSPHPSVPAGSSYEFVLAFNPQNLTSAPDPFGGLKYGLAEGSLRINAVILTTDNVTISIDNRTGQPDVVRIDAIDLTGPFTANVRFNFAGSSTLFSSNDFPSPFPTLADFPVIHQIVVNTATTNTGTVTVFGPE